MSTLRTEGFRLNINIYFRFFHFWTPWDHTVGSLFTVTSHERHVLNHWWLFLQKLVQLDNENKISKLRSACPLCERNPPMTDGFHLESVMRQAIRYH